MLRIYEDIQAMQVDARRLCKRIARHDKQLAGQLRWAAQSVALNTAEGMAGSAGMRRKSYAVAAQEARECMAAIETAGRWGYTEAEASVVDRCDKIVGTLWRLAHPRG